MANKRKPKVRRLNPAPKGRPAAPVASRQTQPAVTHDDDATISATLRDMASGDRQALVYVGLMFAGLGASIYAIFTLVVAVQTGALYYMGF